MDWNLKTPAEWDWENLAMLSGKTVEILRQVQLSSNDIEGKGVENGSLYSPAGAAFSISDLGCRSTSKSSIGASADSSLKEGVKTFNPVDGLPKDCTRKDEIVGEKVNGNYSTLGPAVNSVEPMIGLKLGKRIYFEDICAAGTSKTTSFSVISTSSALPTKRSRASYHSTPTPRCQVEGCNLDLKSAKDYHRRHRICENHSKSPRVTVAGLERRFCQQCSRFHDLSEFDDKKRSCRRRLSDHNARRRRPRPEAIQFRPARHPSSLYEGRQQVLLNRLPSQVSHPTWHNACNFEITECGDSFSMPAKTASFYRQPLMSSDELPNSNSMLQFDSDRMLSFQSTTPRVLNHNLAPSAFTSNLDAAPDLRRALSLLSTNNSWGLNEPESTSLKQFIHVNQSSVPQQLMHAEPQFTELAPSQYLRVEQPPAVSRVDFLGSNGSGSSQFQEFQLCKAPEVGGCFYPNQTNC